MRKNKKRRYTVVQQFTPFERNKTKDILDLIKMRIDPYSVTLVSIGGTSQYSTSDFLNLFELTGHKFDTIATSLKREKADMSVRTKVC